MAHVVTGTSESRLDELRKYAVSGSLSVRYFTSISTAIDGLDISLTTTGVTASTYTYYIGGITYVDKINTQSTGTTFTFTSLGLDDPNNFDDLPYIKIESKQNMVENSQVSVDVFISRQSLSVFEKNYRLRGLGSMSDLLSYAGGNYFIIYNNT